MPVNNSWYIEGRVTLTVLRGRITAAELAEGGRQGTALNDAGIAPVYSLVDMTGLENFPTQFGEFKQVIQQGKSDKLSWIIIYGIPNKLANFLTTMFAQLVRTNFKVVNTQAEALELIEQLDGGMPTAVPLDLISR